MTESDWLTCTDPQPMLEFLRGKVSDRKLRLFAVACCRRMWHSLSNVSRQAVGVAEQYTDGNASVLELAASYNAADRLEDELLWDSRWGEAIVARLARVACDEVGSWEPWYFDRETKVFLRCIFGSPFRPIALDPGWLTPTVKQLAEAIYEERAFDRLPVLADALEDAGCNQQDILGHLRSGGDHVRGCWAVDLVTGRE